MKSKLARRARHRKQKLTLRNDRCSFGNGGPVLNSRSRSYELSERVNATAYGGVGPILDLLRRCGFAATLNARLNLLQNHRPYHESDHVINLALNFLCGGTCLDDIEKLRSDTALLDALGVRRLPDPTTAGDFLRRFGHDDNRELMDAINDGNRWAWRQAATEGSTAVLDVDSSIVETTGECKTRMDITYTGRWGFHPLLITEATTGTDVCLVNRPGNQTSQQDAAYWIEYAIAEVEQSFADVRLRGDTAFYLPHKFDEWNEAGVEFCFGAPATRRMRKIAEKLKENRWRSPRPHVPKTTGRAPTERQERSRQRNFHDVQAHKEHVADFRYRPSACSQDYRVIVVRKQLILSGGQRGLFGELDTRYFFYITNIEDESAAEVLDFIHKRCDHENRIEQLKNGMPAMHTPCADFQANQAWMLIGALAHNIKSWLCLMHPDETIRRRLVSWEFKAFFREFILIPCQVLHTGRRLTLRFLNTTNAFPELVSIAQALN